MAVINRQILVGRGVTLLEEAYSDLSSGHQVTAEFKIEAANAYARLAEALGQASTTTRPRSRGGVDW